MPRIPQTTVAVAMMLLGTLIVTALLPNHPAPTEAAPQPATTQSATDRATLLGKWVTTYKLGDKDRSLAYTFKDDGTFEEHDSNWGRNWGDWRLDGKALHMHWRGRRGFNGTMHVESLTDTQWVSRYPAATVRTFTRPAK